MGTRHFNFAPGAGALYKKCVWCARSTVFHNFVVKESAAGGAGIHVQKTEVQFFMIAYLVLVERRLRGAKVY